MRVSFVATMLAFVAVPALAQDVDVGKISWAKLPALKERPSALDYADLAKRVSAILASGHCKLPGQTPNRFDITVPYALLVEPSGKVSRIVVSEMNCTALETLVGHAVLARSDVGDYLPTGEAKPRWYASALNFNLR